ncbi:MAG TPA: hypothetical protein VFY66_14525, partial [Anaerolineales bacterium]|nr:hypothetical protein [Anaerolineales bacterium]
MFSILMLLFALASFVTQPARAQAEPPLAGPLGAVRGTVINRNTGQLVKESLEVMLHILDQNLVDKGMEHGQSQPDGTFVFPDIPFDENTQFAVMTTYDGVTYSSETIAADLTTLEVSIEMPVYETTTDLATIQIEQMHILFETSPDGLETKELYIISNTGERTVKDVFDLGEGKFAAIKFPLPEDADYIFFKPDDPDRFVKLDGAFADSYPVLPGGQASQIMTSYLIPYSGERQYTYKAPVNVAQINFLLPDQAGIALKGTGLIGPEPTTLQDGTSYQVYSYSNLKAGQTLSLTLNGGAATSNRAANSSNNLIAGLAAFLGFGVIGFGLWRWHTSEAADADEVNAEAGEQTLDDLIAEIARLDEIYERQGLNVEEYQSQRKAL